MYICEYEKCVRIDLSFAVRGRQNYMMKLFTHYYSPPWGSFDVRKRRRINFCANVEMLSF